MNYKIMDEIKNKILAETKVIEIVTDETKDICENVYKMHFSFSHIHNKPEKIKSHILYDEIAKFTYNRTEISLYYFMHFGYVMHDYYAIVLNRYTEKDYCTKAFVIEPQKENINDFFVELCKMFSLNYLSCIAFNPKCRNFDYSAQIKIAEKIGHDVASKKSDEEWEASNKDKVKEYFIFDGTKYNKEMIDELFYEKENTYDTLLLNNVLIDVKTKVREDAIKMAQQYNIVKPIIYNAQVNESFV